ncbi:MAG: hypothetical protein NPIRA05_15550 [Nitrospirales bacterium]|nr:MAG: hypothetical protein NPIRA05_15550 [Nitrospirales bacterium]
MISLQALLPGEMLLYTLTNINGFSAKFAVAPHAAMTGSTGIFYRITRHVPGIELRSIQVRG